MYARGLVYPSYSIILFFISNLCSVLHFTFTFTFGYYYVMENVYYFFFSKYRIISLVI